MVEKDDKKDGAGAPPAEPTGTAPTPPAPRKAKSERETLWEEYLANYKASNPVKYAQKRATTYVDAITGKSMPKKDEFAEIPASFKGIKITKKTQKGLVTYIY